MNFTHHTVNLIVSGLPSDETCSRSPVDESEDDACDAASLPTHNSARDDDSDSSQHHPSSERIQPNGGSSFRS